MDAMKLAMELFRDDETGSWGYRIPALSIVGTGCRSREEAQQLGYEAIGAHLEDEGSRIEGDVVLFDVEIAPVLGAG